MPGGHFEFSQIFQIAQGWELHTHLNIIMHTLTMNNQQIKKTLTDNLGQGKFGLATAGNQMSKAAGKTKFFYELFLFYYSLMPAYFS